MRSSLTFILLVLLASTVSAEQPVDYIRDVKPILSERCFGCHGKLKQKGALRLDVSGLIFQGGNEGSPIVRGKSAESLLIHSVTGTNDATLMPAEGGGAPLTAPQIDILKRWIDQGAKAPDEPIPPDPKDHWSFKAPVRPEVPQLEAGWARNPIDNFIAAGHAAKNLKRQQPAPPEVLLRRIYLDLIGLPPTPEQLRAFLKDPSRAAYEKIVDELLASPRYGERWGRHWMDIWRYSDWAGYGMEVRDSQPHIWRWRDWIIESLNADKPYDRMVVEMLAGDEIAPADPQVTRATGYLSRSFLSFNRNVWLDNVVEHTGKAFLGITLNCARCHDHMFDPLSQQEHYQFRAFFEPYHTRVDRVPGQRDMQKDGLSRTFDQKLDVETFLFRNGLESDPVKDKPIAPGTPKVLGGKFEIKPVALPLQAYYPGLQDFVVREELAALKDDLRKAEEDAAKTATTLAATAKNSPAKPDEAAADLVKEPAVFIADNFAGPNTDVWMRAGGQWDFKNGRLCQSLVGMASHDIVSIANHPQDFSATFKFKITGGNTWCSVGLSFDSGGDAANIVYLSAYNGGPKVQIAWRFGTQWSYPVDGHQGQPIRLNQDYELRVDAKDTLMNVYLDGKPLLAFRLPHARRAGKFSLLTFDAMAEFASVRVEELPAGKQLFEKLPGAGGNTQQALELAEQAAALAKAKFEHNAATLASFEARLSAERMKFGLEQGTPEQTKDAALKAGRAERAAKAAKAAVDVLNAEHKLADVRAAQAKKANPQAVKDAEKALADQKKTATDAVAAVDKAEAAYSPLVGQVHPTTSSGRRLAVANWIVDRNNPLAARVAANHMWLRHFGEPLVPTVFDFGLNGKPAVNQKLLDWLAVELLDRGWSMKALHKLMVTSAVYQMHSSHREEVEENRKLDPDNLHLWRMNSRRMEAEIVRDSVLATSGKLNLAMGGPELDFALGLSSQRRSVYYRHALEKQMTFLKVFDAASPVEAYRRAESVVPQQALAQANNPMTLAQGRLLAAELTKQLAADNSPTAFVNAAFERVLCRAPLPAERERCAAFLTEQADRLKNSSKQTFDGGMAGAVKPSADPQQRARENLVHVLFNHNDFVTIR